MPAAAEKQLSVTVRAVSYVVNPVTGYNACSGLRQTRGLGPCRSFVVGNYVIFFRGVSDGVEIVRIVRGERDIEMF